MNQSSVDMMMIRRSSTSSRVATSSAKRAMNQTQKRSHLMNSKNIGIDSKTKPKSSTRGVSPSPSPSPLALVRSTNIPAAPRLISDEAAIPPNLRTDRSCSASRGRRPAGTGNQKPDQLSTKAAAAARRQSCSPSVTRGRKVVEQQQQVVVVVENKVRIPSGTQVLGSRMVDKFMNARKSSTEDRETNPKLRSGSINESSGFGRIMSKTSLDMALKHMDIKRDRPVNFRQVGTTTGKDSATVGSRTPSS
ncbi:hypothetical protein F0562_025529 [Nyssa sinensis]|uniref:Uncharacterized protein n=1 Tax=Nyssa sinensis TaxID=561372 RepID=A0A5J5BAP5_9ASTE|nr:hypothetical protein F0562_025529 [Nyssa sinensis]